MQYGFVIDHDSCIGCHACTVACKSENEVPVGQFRTWVKYTEEGVFPEVKRTFAVLRCNHCSDAPCVTICPVNALEKRDDGIVDIDRDACIGCRACMQACPYDALSLNQDTGSVEKCHYCAHRIEQGREPACVTVCPVGAIVPGDVTDPASPAGRLVAERTTTVRRPEQGTGPNVHYIGASDVALNPGAAERPATYIWSDRPPDKNDPWPTELPLEPAARTVLDVGHRVEWGWGVAAYLVTKGVAAGAAMLAPFAGMFGLEGFAASYAPEIIALVFTLVTVVLLIEDLARPMLFYRLLTRPNMKSWLVRGGLVLGAFGAVEAAVIGATMLGWDVTVLRWLGAVLGLAVAGYTALLFAQCKGRDLWESRILLPHLLVQAALCGGVALLVLAPGSIALKIIVLAATFAHVNLALAERHGRHETDNARQAAAFLGTIMLGPFKPFRDGLIVSACALVLVFLAPTGAWVPALVGLLLYEHAFVRAGQLPPLS